MAGWQYRLDGPEFEWIPRVGDGQGGLACCDSWGRKESNSSEWLSWTELNIYTRWGADCGSNHELLIAKFRLKLKKVGKTTRRFRYDLNQIPYDYTVEVTNRFKGLDLIECLKNYGERFMTLYSDQGGSDQDHSLKKERQKGKMVVWGGLTNSWEEKRS